MAAEKIARQGLTWRHVGVVATMMLAMLTAVGIIFTAAGLCYRPVSQHFGVQTSQVALYITCVYLGQMVGAAPAGVLFDKFNARGVCLVAALMVVVPYLGFAFYPAIWCYWVAGFIIGLGLVCVEFTMTAGILSRWFHTNYGTVTGLCFAFTGIGGMVWNIVGQFVLGPNLLTEETWRNLYLIFGIVSFIGTVPWTLFALRNHPQDVGLKAYGEPLSEGEVIDEEHVVLKGVEPKVAYTKWYFYVLIVAGCLMNICGIYPQHYTTYYQTVVACDALGQQIPELMIMSGTLEAFSMVGMAVGKVTTGAVESKSVQAALILGVGTGILGIAAIWWGGYNKILPILFGGGFIYGCIYAFVTTLLPYLTRQIFGDLHYDKIYSVILIPVNLVGATAASGLALINQSFGWNAFFILDIVVMVIIYLLCTICYKAGRKDYLDKVGA